MNKQPKYYSQEDPKWSKIPYNVDNDPQKTIGYSGCGPTSMAMILATWVDAKITPVETCKLAISLKDRTADEGTEWEFFAHVGQKYNLDFHQTDSTGVAVAAIKEGAYVVCSMGPGHFTKSGHFILAWDITDNGNIRVNDPDSTSKTAQEWAQSIFIPECRQYFIFKQKK
jgi:hypothetical protein